jgi:hypothetical protein
LGRGRGRGRGRVDLPSSRRTCPHALQALCRTLTEMADDLPPSDAVLANKFMELLISDQTRVFSSPPGHRLVT